MFVCWFSCKGHLIVPARSGLRVETSVQPTLATGMARCAGCSEAFGGTGLNPRPPSSCGDEIPMSRRTPAGATPRGVSSACMCTRRVPSARARQRAQICSKRGTHAPYESTKTTSECRRQWLLHAVAPRHSALPLLPTHAYTHPTAASTSAHMACVGPRAQPGKFDSRACRQTSDGGW